MDLTEEKIDKDGHEPQEGVVFPVAHGVELGGRLWRAGALGRHRQTRARGRGGGIIGRHVRSCSDGDPAQRCWGAFWWKRRGRMSARARGARLVLWCGGVLIQSGSGLIEAETEAYDGSGRGRPAGYATIRTRSEERDPQMDLTAMAQTQQCRGHSRLKFERVLIRDARRRRAGRRVGSIGLGHGRNAGSWMLKRGSEYPQPAVRDTLLRTCVDVEQHGVRRRSPS